jgi:hypothetical protein
MTGEREMVEVLPEAFRVALLLTGSTEAAEAAALDGIASLELDHISDDSLLLVTAKSAIQRRRESLEQSDGFSILPLELRRLSLLPPNDRDCFVLRILVGLTPRLCSRLLRLPIQTVADALYTALQELRRIEPCGMDRRESVHPAHDVQVRSRTSPTGETHGS